jgi:hypothetical protein
MLGKRGKEMTDISLAALSGHFVTLLKCHSAQANP